MAEGPRGGEQKVSTEVTVIANGEIVLLNELKLAFSSIFDQDLRQKKLVRRSSESWNRRKCLRTQLIEKQTPLTQPSEDSEEVLQYGRDIRNMGVIRD